MNEDMKQVFDLNNEEKYEYFIDTIMEHKEVWILRDEEGCASLGTDEVMVLPVWPEEAYAKECISGEWSSYLTAAIALDVFVDRWLPGLMGDGIRLNLLWMNGKGVEVAIADLLADLKEELEDEHSKG